jgi:DNA-binding transcriptional LysR family regulator
MNTKRNLPPLRSLQVFEALGRNLSLTTAANELLISESAVSQQLKSLERFFGAALCVRLPRGIELTAEGKQFLETTTRCLDEISAVSDAIGTGQRQKAVRLQVTAHFSTHWLAPRLKALKHTSSLVKLTLSEHSGPVPRLAAAVDIAIFWGDTAPAGTVAERLFEVGYVPMCSPDLLDGRSPLDITQVVSTYPLLAHGNSITWEQWCDWARIKPGPLARALHFDNYDVLIEAAVQGNGLALITIPMFGRYLEEGRLVAPFGTRTAHPVCVSIAYRRDALQRPEVAQVRDWLIREARKWRRENQDSNVA